MGEVRQLATSDLYFAGWVLSAVDGARLKGTTIDATDRVTWQIEGTWGDSDLASIYRTGGMVDGFAYAASIKKLKRQACGGK